MTAQRVIFTLADGRRKYATHNGSMLFWEQDDLASLRENIDNYGMPAFTADFMKFDVSFDRLRNRYPDARIVRVVAVESEDARQPRNPEIIF